MTLSMSTGHLTLLTALVLYGASGVNVVKILSNRRMTSSAAMAWILIHLFLPFIALPLFWLLGDFRITGYVRRYRATAQERAVASQSFVRLPPPPTEAMSEPLRTLYLSFKTTLSKLGPLFLPQRGEVELLIDGQNTFEAIFEAIADARHYILVQYYIVRHDRLGLELKRLLIEKAQAGIPVYMLFDDMGSFWLSRDYLRDLKKNGVAVGRFLPIASFKRFFQVNFRNHRKLVIVDGKVAFTGGLNVGEEYAAPRSRKSMRYWRDTHLAIRGGATQQLEELFLEDWYFAQGEKINLPQPSKSKSKLKSEEGRPAKDYVAVQLVPMGPTDSVLVSVLFVLHLLNSAQKRVWIATPYLVPDQSILRALELAVLRGVDVRVILPKEADSRLVHWVSLSYADQLQGKGVKVMLYDLGFMHQKVILLDDHVAAVGTMNLDNRAMYLNFEIMVLIFNEAFGIKVKHMLLDDFLTCRFYRLEGGKWSKRLRKMRGNAARLLAPLL